MGGINGMKNHECWQHRLASCSDELRALISFFSFAQQ